MPMNGAIGEFAISELDDEGSPTLPPTPTVVRYSSHSFTTGSAETPANTFVSGRLLSNFSVTRRIERGAEGRFGGLLRATVSSQLDLANGDRGLDSLLSGFVDGREVKIKLGEVVTDAAGARTITPYTDLTDVLTTVAGGVSGDDRTVQLALRDQGVETVLQSALQSRRYGGGKKGGAKLKGRSKPLVYGEVHNVEPQLVDGIRLIYQVSTSAATSLTVMDSGIEVPLGSAEADYDALAAASITPGEMATVLDDNGGGAYFRLGTSAIGRVTANMVGPGTSTSAIIDLILDVAGVPASGRSISNLADAGTDKAGYFLPAGSGNVTVETAVSALAQAAGAVFGADRSGVYRLVWLDSEALNGTPDWEFTDREITSIDKLPLPYGVPWDRWKVGTERNWTVQKADELATSVDEDTLTFLEREFKAVYTEDPDVSLYHATTRETELIETFYREAAPTTRFSNRMQSWYGFGRELYEITVKTALAQIEIGDIVEVTVPLHGLDSGKAFMAVGVTDDLTTGESQIRLFG